MANTAENICGTDRELSNKDCPKGYILNNEGIIRPKSTPQPTGAPGSNEYIIEPEVLDGAVAVPGSVRVKDGTIPGPPEGSVRVKPGTEADMNRNYHYYGSGYMIRPEVYLNNEWRPICKQRFLAGADGSQQPGPDKICKQLGYASGVKTHYAFSCGSRGCHTRSACPTLSPSQNLKDCPVTSADRTWLTTHPGSYLCGPGNPSMWQATRVHCRNPINPVRQSDKSIIIKPELYMNNQWKPICKHWFHNNNKGADKICKQLGYTSGMPTPGPGPRDSSLSFDVGDSYHTVGICPTLSSSQNLSNCPPQPPVPSSQVSQTCNNTAGFGLAGLTVQCNNPINPVRQSGDKKLWKPICLAGFWNNNTGANIGCRLMGYNNGEMAYGIYGSSNASYPTSSTARAIGACSTPDRGKGKLSRCKQFRDLSDTPDTITSNWGCASAPRIAKLKCSGPVATTSPALLHYDKYDNYHCGLTANINNSGVPTNSLQDGIPYGWQPPNGDISRCLEKCSNDPQCQAVSFKPTPGRCYWKKNITPSTMFPPGQQVTANWLYQGDHDCYISHSPKYIQHPFDCEKCISCPYGKYNNDGTGCSSPQPICSSDKISSMNELYTAYENYHCGGTSDLTNPGVPTNSLQDGAPYGWTPSNGDISVCLEKCSNDPQCQAISFQTNPTRCYWKKNISTNTMHPPSGARSPNWYTGNHTCYIAKPSSAPQSHNKYYKCKPTPNYQRNGNQYALTMSPIRFPYTTGEIKIESKSGPYSNGITTPILSSTDRNALGYNVALPGYSSLGGNNSIPSTHALPSMARLSYSGDLGCKSTVINRTNRPHVYSGTCSPCEECSRGDIRIKPGTSPVPDGNGFIIHPQVYNPDGRKLKEGDIRILPGTDMTAGNHAARRNRWERLQPQVYSASSPSPAKNGDIRIAPGTNPRRLDWQRSGLGRMCNATSFWNLLLNDGTPSILSHNGDISFCLEKCIQDKDCDSVNYNNYNCSLNKNTNGHGNFYGTIASNRCYHNYGPSSNAPTPEPVFIHPQVYKSGVWKSIYRRGLLHTAATPTSNRLAPGDYISNIMCKRLGFVSGKLKSNWSYGDCIGGCEAIGELRPGAGQPIPTATPYRNIFNIPTLLGSRDRLGWSDHLPYRRPGQMEALQIRCYGSRDACKDGPCDWKSIHHSNFNGEGASKICEQLGGGNDSRSITRGSQRGECVGGCLTIGALTSPTPSKITDSFGTGRVGGLSTGQNAVLLSCYHPNGVPVNRQSYPVSTSSPKWKSINKHYFWDSSHGPQKICNQLGYTSGQTYGRMTQGGGREKNGDLYNTNVCTNITNINDFSDKNHGITECTGPGPVSGSHGSVTMPNTVDYNALKVKCSGGTETSRKSNDCHSAPCTKSSEPCPGNDGTTCDANNYPKYGRCGVGSKGGNYRKDDMIKNTHPSQVSGNYYNPDQIDGRYHEVFTANGAYTDPNSNTPSTSGTDFGGTYISSDRTGHSCKTQITSPGSPHGIEGICKPPLWYEIDVGSGWGKTGDSTPPMKQRSGTSILVGIEITGKNTYVSEFSIKWSNEPYFSWESAEATASPLRLLNSGGLFNNTDEQLEGIGSVRLSNGKLGFKENNSLMYLNLANPQQAPGIFYFKKPIEARRIRVYIHKYKGVDSSNRNPQMRIRLLELNPSYIINQDYIDNTVNPPRILHKASHTNKYADPVINPIVSETMGKGWSTNKRYFANRGLKGVACYHGSQIGWKNRHGVDACTLDGCPCVGGEANVRGRLDESSRGDTSSLQQLYSDGRTGLGSDLSQSPKYVGKGWIPWGGTRGISQADATYIRQKQNAPYWYQIDLKNQNGQIPIIFGAITQGEHSSDQLLSYVREFNIYISMDEKNWTQLKSNSSDGNFTDDLKRFNYREMDQKAFHMFPFSVKTRYIRFYPKDKYSTQKSIAMRVGFIGTYTNSDGKYGFNCEQKGIWLSGTCLKSPEDKKPSTQKSKFISCSPGYRMSSRLISGQPGQCLPNICECPGGSPPPQGDPSCKNHKEKVCMSCNNGYTINTKNYTHYNPNYDHIKFSSSYGMAKRYLTCSGDNKEYRAPSCAATNNNKSSPTLGRYFNNRDISSKFHSEHGRLHSYEGWLNHVPRHETAPVCSRSPYCSPSPTPDQLLKHDWYQIEVSPTKRVYGVLTQGHPWNKRSLGDFYVQVSTDGINWTLQQPQYTSSSNYVFSDNRSHTQTRDIPNSWASWKTMDATTLESQKLTQAERIKEHLFRTPVSSAKYVRFLPKNTPRGGRDVYQSGRMGLLVEKSSGSSVCQTFGGTCQNGSLIATPSRQYINHCGPQCSPSYTNSPLQPGSSSSPVRCINYGGTCQNGVLIPTPSRQYNDHCGTCNSGYHIAYNIVGGNRIIVSPRRCVPNICNCPNGTARATQAPQCMQHNQQSCISCTPGYRLSQPTASPQTRICISCPIGKWSYGNNTTTTCSPAPCNNGNHASISARNGPNQCSSCNSGYNLTNTPSPSRCMINRCICPNGTATSGTSCQSNGNQSCSQCSPGYRPIQSPNPGPTVCRQNVCTCQNGIAGTGTSCRTHGKEGCQSCQAGSVAIPTASPAGPTICRQNLCVCPNGAPLPPADPQRTVNMCPNYGAYACDTAAGTCNQGYHPTPSPTPGGQYRICVENRCTCPNGSIGTGNACGVHNNEGCSSCNSGYSLTQDSPGPSVCRTTTCICPNGTATSGISCQSNGTQSCSQCSPGYRPIQSPNPGPTVCRQNVCTCAYGTPAIGNQYPSTPCPSPSVNRCALCNTGYLLNSSNYTCGKQCSVPSSPALRGMGIKSLTISGGSFSQTTQSNLTNNQVDIELKNNHWVKRNSDLNISCLSNGNLNISGIIACTPNPMCCRSNIPGCASNGTLFGKCSRYVGLVSGKTKSDWISAVNDTNTPTRYINLINKRYLQCSTPQPGYFLGDESRNNPWRGKTNNYRSSIGNTTFQRI